ncbi:stage V sporulation protein B [Lysinibacillus sp. 2017]|uniref:putative polysaccharide biosynthesis protein n=1 Tax=unclassified Lysinibacillus TaxID=2636778 RepID=UPI000D52A1AF|nr:MULTISPECIES: oligosaccharide flippase family protein [unclassified Lysinibacillus]AWE08153.1 stage V sporulation protein B [Lysinibacillus sp. 2017]TGN36342.1 polysaccharide biosynthesis protein [Lysinibacillus sp. S2017]
MGSFLKGTLFLMFVIFISKLFGFVYRMQFMRIAGEEIVGLYMTSYPAFIFFISVIQFGIPIAVAKLVAHVHAKQKDEHISSIMRTATKLSFLFIIIFTPIIALTIPYIAKSLLHNENLIYILYVGLCTVPIIIFSGLMKSYLQGLTKIGPTAWAQLLEQIVRITLTVFLLPFFMDPNEPAKTAAYAMGITALGEVFSFLFLGYYYIKSKRTFKKNAKTPSYFKPIVRVAVPSAGSKLFGTFTWFLEPIIFLKALTVSGITAGAATTLYGVISGVHIPLLLFPAFIPSALAIVLIPAVSSAVASKNWSLLNQRISLSLRLSSIVGCIAASFFFLHGDDLTMKLFHLEENRGYMKILAPIFYFYYIQSPLHSILQAVDEAKVAMMNSIYGGIGKLFLLYLLASQSSIQEHGAIVAIGFGVLITSFLHIATIRQHEKMKVGIKFFVIPYFLFILTCFIQPLLTPNMPLFMSCFITICIVITLLLATGQIRSSDWQYIRSIFSRT